MSEIRPRFSQRGIERDGLRGEVQRLVAVGPGVEPTMSETGARYERDMSVI